MFRDRGNIGEGMLRAALTGALLVALNLGCLASSSGKVGRSAADQPPPARARTPEGQQSSQEAPGPASQTADTSQPPGTGQASQASKEPHADQTEAGDNEESSVASGVDKAEPGSGATETTAKEVAEASAWTAQIGGAQVESKNAQSESDGASGTSGHTSSTRSTGGSNGHPAPGNTKEGTLSFLIRLNPPEVNVGEILIAEVIAASPVRVVDAPFTLEYNPSLLRFLDASQGEFLTQSGGSVVFLANGEARPGQVNIGIGRSDRSRGVAGEGTLCRVRFMALATGAASLQIRQAMAWGERGAVIRVESNSVVVAVR